MNLCKCGCGQEVSLETNLYIHGHNKPWKGKNRPNFPSIETRQKMSEIMKTKKGKPHSEETKKKMSLSFKLSIEYIHNKYLLFSKIEQLRYNPDKPGENEIQVHCKNHNCINSKEKDGWFTPTYIQIYERIRSIEKIGNDGIYFYCSNDCKHQCPLYFSHGNLCKQKDKKLYNQEEYQTFRNFVLERDNYICQFCGEKATEVHHERPQKLEPFFALDPDYAWSCCKNCHYKFGHQGECSTGNLASKIC